MKSVNGGIMTHWTELTLISLKPAIDSWMKHVPKDLIDEVTDVPHITVLYGCSNDSSKYTHLPMKAIPWKTSGHVRPGDASDVLLVGIGSEALRSLFMAMYEDDAINTDKKHTLIDGKYDPHVTLAWLKPGAKNDPRIKEACTNFPFQITSGTGDCVICNDE